MRRPKAERFAPKYQMPPIKHDGSNITVWVSFSRDSIGPLHRIKNIMGENVFLDIIKNDMPPHGKDKTPVCWKFWQYSDSKHRANSINFFNSKRFLLSYWPSQSPDLNPTEHLWEQLDYQFKGNKPTNKNDSFKMHSDCCAIITKDVLINLVDSIPRYCLTVLKSPENVL